MKYVSAPRLENIVVTSPDGQPCFSGTQANGEPRPLRQNYQDWLLARTTDEVFASHGGKKEGVDFYELLLLARSQINATRGVVGTHVFDSEVAGRLQQSILHPSGGVIGERAFTHNWIDWVMLWRGELSEAPPVVLAVGEAAE